MVFPNNCLAFRGGFKVINAYSWTGDANSQLEAGNPLVWSPSSCFWATRKQQWWSLDTPLYPVGTSPYRIQCRMNLWVSGFLREAVFWGRDTKFSAKLQVPLLKTPPHFKKIGPRRFNSMNPKGGACILHYSLWRKYILKELPLDLLIQHLSGLSSCLRWQMGESCQMRVCSNCDLHLLSPKEAVS